jgi:hypothetical protein
MKMEAVCSSKMLLNFYQATKHYIPEQSKYPFIITAIRTSNPIHVNCYCQNFWVTHPTHSKKLNSRVSGQIKHLTWLYTGGLLDSTIKHRPYGERERVGGGGAFFAQTYRK